MLPEEHERLPLHSYPYEWTYSMLRDAAQLHLDLLEQALLEGWTIKDSTPYNIQFVGAIDSEGRLSAFSSYGSQLSLEEARSHVPLLQHRNVRDVGELPVLLRQVEDALQRGQLPVDLGRAHVGQPHPPAPLDPRPVRIEGPPR